MAGTMSTWMDAWEQGLAPSPAARRSQARAAARTRESAPADVRTTRYYTREATARVPQQVEEQEREQEQEQESRPLPQPRMVIRRRPRWGLVLLVVLVAALLLGVVIVAPVLINSANTEMQSNLGHLQAQQRDLTAQTTALSAQISALSSPDRVAEQAGRLGLGPAESVSYVTVGGDTTSEQTAAAEGDTTVARR